MKETTVKMTSAQALQKANELLGFRYKTWKSFSRHPNLSVSIIEQFKDYWHWETLAEHQCLPEYMLLQHEDKINWRVVSRTQVLSEDTIRRHKNDVDWYYISQKQKLSEPFIHEFAAWVDWRNICQWQKLSEEFIAVHWLRVRFFEVSLYQKFSESFITKWKDRLYMPYIASHQMISKEFAKKYLDEQCYKLYLNSWTHKSTEFKKAQVKALDMYECHKDYFIAYKKIRYDRYSLMNFQYQYLPGHTYETWCDCSSIDCSFGFSVWTNRLLMVYYPEGILIKCKVYYKDVGRVLPDGRIRCSKMEVLD